MRTLKLPNILSILVTFLILTTATFADTSDIVKGFSKYQAGRLDNLFLDEFVTDLSNKHLLKQFFPETSGNINGEIGISGKRLIPLLAHYVRSDIDGLKKFAQCIGNRVQILSTLRQIPTINSPDYKKYQDALKTIDWVLHFKQDFSNTEFNINSIRQKCDCDNNDTNSINVQVPSTSVFSKILEDEFNEEAKKAITAEVTAVNGLVTYLSVKAEFIHNSKGFWKSSFDSPTTQDIDFHGFMKAIGEITKLVSSELNHNNTGEEKKYIVQAVYIHKLSKALIALGFDSVNREAFKQFVDTSWFLASLSEISGKGEGNADAVEGLIDDFIEEGAVYKDKIDPAAFYTRRPGVTPNLVCRTGIFCRKTWIIGSYYGFSVPNSWAPEVRAFGPIGVEFKFYSGYLVTPTWGPNITATVMFAPVDIGLYITNELKGKDYNVDIGDIKAPSLFVSLSSKHSPASFQLGYQWNVEGKKDVNEDIAFMAFSFDLPLLTLF